MQLVLLAFNQINSDRSSIEFSYRQNSKIYRNFVQHPSKIKFPNGNLTIKKLTFKSCINNYFVHTN